MQMLIKQGSGMLELTEALLAFPHWVALPLLQLSVTSNASSLASHASDWIAQASLGYAPCPIVPGAARIHCEMY